MRKYWPVLAILLSSLSFATKLVSTGIAAPSSKPKGYVLSWSDEFNLKDGSAPDPAKWTYDIGGNGWGNHELEYYTKRPENVRIEKGKLVITARREVYKGEDGVRREYTSTRLKSQGLFAQAYGRFEARIKLPAGQGIWPAFWALGDDIDKVEWPKCGEIDIMENIGKEPATNHGSLHGPSSEKPTSDLSAAFSLPGGKRLSDDYHLYAIEWEPASIRFYFDSHPYATFTPSQLAAGGKWVYDHPFFILLNVAVGGDWPGSPDVTTVFPQKMFVDYVRVYKKSPQS
jgi:beta-glucanase (GH16 family)